MEKRLVDLDHGVVIAGWGVGRCIGEISGNEKIYNKNMRSASTNFVRRNTEKILRIYVYTYMKKVKLVEKFHNYILNFIKYALNEII